MDAVRLIENARAVGNSSGGDSMKSGKLERMEE